MDDFWTRKIYVFLQFLKENFSTHSVPGTLWGMKDADSQVSTDRFLRELQWLYCQIGQSRITSNTGGS